MALLTHLKLVACVTLIVSSNQVASVGLDERGNSRCDDPDCVFSNGGVMGGILNDITDLNDVLSPSVSPAQVLDDSIQEKIAPSIVIRYLSQLTEAGYDPRVRPHPYTKKIEVSLSMFIGGISALSESEMDFTADLYLRQLWTDHRLRWNPQKFGVDSLIIGGDFLDFLWRPDVYFTNAKKARTHDVTRGNTFVRVTPNGQVKYSIRVTVTAHCPMNFELFPMDNQICQLVLQSYSLPQSDLTLSWRNFNSASQKEDLSSAIALAPNTNNLPQFSIRGIRPLETVTSRMDGNNHSTLVIEFYFTRSLGYYLIQVYLPVCLIVAISWVSFWLSRNSQPARVILGATTVLTLTLMTVQGSAFLPKISYLKALDLFMIFCFSMVFMALIEFAIVSYISKRIYKQRQDGQTHVWKVNAEGETVREFSTAHKPFLALTMLATIPIGSPFLPRIDFSNLAAAAARGNSCNDKWKRNWEFRLPVSLPSKIEWASRFGFPLTFLTFNIIYWNYFLKQRNLANTDNIPGFIDFTES